MSGEGGGSGSKDNDGSLRDELTGHLSVLMLSVLGLGMYSGVYSVSMSLGAYRNVVPILEMWMAFSQLGCSLSCLAIQVVVAGMLGVQGGVRGLPNTQVAIFLGIACAVTCIASECLSGNSFECQIYFPASVFPPISAVCGIVWSWLMYFAALGVAGGAAGFSIGLQGAGGIYAACVMAMLPPGVLYSLVTLCGETSVWKSACSGLFFGFVLLLIWWVNTDINTGGLGLCGYTLVCIGGLASLVCVYVGIYIFEKAVDQRVRLSGVGVQLVGVVLAIVTGTLFVPNGSSSLSYKLTTALLAFLTMVHNWRLATTAEANGVDAPLALPASVTSANNGRSMAQAAKGKSN